MKHLREITGVLRIVEQLPNSKDGNPRYLAMVGITAFRTIPNSDLVHALRNYEGKQVRVELGIRRGKIHLAGIEEVNE